MTKIKKPVYSMGNPDPVYFTYSDKEEEVKEPIKASCNVWGVDVHVVVDGKRELSVIELKFRTEYTVSLGRSMSVGTFKALHFSSEKAPDELVGKSVEIFAFWLDNKDGDVNTYYKKNVKIMSYESGIDIESDCLEGLYTFEEDVK